jgi:Ca2+-binding EF-hand superfamily protein
VEKLYELFKVISSSGDDDGLIDKSEFQSALGLKRNLFVDRMFELFDANGDQSINFAEFVAGLSTFTTRAKPAEKAKFSFKMYDFNGDELIDKQELGRMLQATIDENNLNISPAQAQQLIDDTFEEANTATPGYITFEEYSAMVSKKPQVHPCPLWVHLGLRLTQSRRPVQLLEFMTIQSLNSLIS